MPGELTTNDPQHIVHGWVTHQAAACRAMGSEIYGHLMGVAAADVLDGGPCWEVLRHKADDRFGNAIPLRFFGAVHRVALRGDAPELASKYPSCGGSGLVDVALSRAFLDVVAQHSSELILQLEQGVQTNEVQRSTALMPALVHISNTTHLPIRLIELGTSGGLNLRLDYFGYHGIDGQQAGDQQSPLLFSKQFQTPVPLNGPVAISERIGCDPFPIDPLSPAGYQLLKSFVWPDQIERVARLDAAVAIAGRVPATVIPAAAIDVVRAKLASAVPGVATVIMHSIVWQYVDFDERRAITECIQSAGQSASEASPIFWLTLEPQSSAAKFPHLTVRSWPGSGDVVRLAEAGFHGEFVRWLL